VVTVLIDPAALTNGVYNGSITIGPAQSQYTVLPSTQSVPIPITIPIQLTVGTPSANTNTGATSTPRQGFARKK